MTNETLETLKSRRSIRSFEPRQVEREKIEAILEAGLYAPTARGQQSPIFIVVQDPEARAQLRRMNAAVAGIDSDPYYGAPTILLVLSERTNCWLQDGSCAIDNLLNAAHAVGLGGCWINREYEMFESEEGKALLRSWGVPDGYTGVGAVSLGYPAGKAPQAAPRKEGRVYWVD